MAMPENQTTYSDAFGTISEEALQVIPLSFEACRSSPYRFFLLSFLGFLLSCAALAFGFFTASQVLVPEPSESVLRDWETGRIMANTQRSWKMAPKKSPWCSTVSISVGSGISGGE